MQSKAKTPRLYLEALEDDWRRETLLELRDLVAAEAPDALEGMAYGMLSYTYEGKALFALNAQKSYVSLYVGDARKIDPDGSMLEGLNRGKGCVRFTKSVNVAETGIRAFIAEAARMAREGLDIDC